MFTTHLRYSLSTLALGWLAASAYAAPADYFRIDVVDADTGRGVPLVELKTTSEVRYVTDSNGIVAIDDADLLGQKVYFAIKSHGYSYPKDQFGYSGQSFDVKAGGRGQIKIKRENVAERLYRITGAGIYRDSLLVGAPVPIKQPLLNGLVTGQDTVDGVPYAGKIFWLWGDTNKPSYPLGNFHTSAATSLPPGKGGLDPDKGVDLTYWVDSEGFSKKMIPMPGDKPVWMGGLFTMPDDKGKERLFGPYAQVESDSKTLEAGLSVFNDEKAIFEKVASYGTTLQPGGRPFRATVGGKLYLYFHAFLRTPADYAHVTDPTRYEAYTCLAPGAKYDGANTRLERDAAGKLVYGWKANTAGLEAGQERTLIDAKKMAPAEALQQFHDVETGALVDNRGGSVHWNSFKKKWVRITGQANGTTSHLGEIWYAEADTPTGPWAYARKVITHDNYTFYNVAQHPFFDQDNGRLIYFEGTYCTTYSGNKFNTPRYDYNQIMYRLSLDDSRLSLPVPVYKLKNGEYATADNLAAKGGWGAVASIPFFGVPKATNGLVPVYASGTSLKTTPVVGAQPLFYALPVEKGTDEKENADLMELSEANQKLGRVWRSRSEELPLDNVVAAK
ncbi:hypothetical protein EON80_05375 [bacterium]|nr:MAG: hypothetical protein EON80_05375 [bacterium]